MIKEIKFNGYSANPSDYECADGDLSMAFNVIPEDGAMKPIFPPAVRLSVSGNAKLRFIHTTNMSDTHYIFTYGNAPHTLIAFIDANSISNNKISTDSLSTILKIPQPNYTFSHFNAVGNTLMAFASDAIYYFLFINENYVYLGTQIPECPLSFGLVGHPRLFSLSDESKSKFLITFDPIALDKIYDDLSQANKSRITEQIMAKVNRFIAQETINKGRFCFPFFVRYALRLFDGSLVRHSPPILMCPSTSTVPVVTCSPQGKNHFDHADNCDIMLVAADLDFCIIDKSFLDDLQKWSDIVKSVDIFISKPLYSFDQDGEISNFFDNNNFKSEFIGRLYANPDKPTADVITVDSLLAPFSDINFINDYAEWPFSQIYSMYFAPDRTFPNYSIHLPEFSEGKVRETIQNTSSFFLLKSVPIDNIPTSRSLIVIEDDYLQSLVNREVMSDDYLSNDRIAANCSFTYNNRINLASIRRFPYAGFFPQSSLAFCNAAFNFSIADDNATISLTPLNNASFRYSAEVCINEDGKKFRLRNNGVDCFPLIYFLSFNRVSTILKISGYNTLTESIDGNTSTYLDYNSPIYSRSTSSELKPRSWGNYFFYPSVNAYQIIIYSTNDDAEQSDNAIYTIDLSPHDFLNGAFAFIDFNSVRQVNYDPENFVSSLPEIPENLVLPNTNKIYTSEVNNPFYFPALGINTVGTGNILGICAAAKALSEGQFGQFPLYAFTSEGVWALEVSATGTYSAKQPITRDVVINPDSITQIDSAVLFATDRGIMLISGSTVQCISDRLNTEELFSIADLPKCDKLINIFNVKADDQELITLDQLTLLPFSEFLAGCRMVYDYTNQHIIVYNPAVRYAYVYSLKSQTWGMMRSDIVDNVNSYPEALAMADGARLVDFSKPVAENITALIITRPFKIDDPNTFKTINTIIQRGMFRSTHVQQVLYGSNDLIHWHTVWSSVDKIMRGFRGTPYKAFRLALVCKFDKGESIYGCTVVYEPRMTNQVR